MKRKLLIRCMMAAAALLTASCTSDDLVLEGGSLNGVNDEEVEVTFSVSAESVQASTRADGGETIDGIGGPGRWQNYIGKGKEIDLLIYAVYEEVKDADGNVKYNLLEQYGQGYMKYAEGTTTPITEFPANLGKIEDHKGQTIYNVGDVFKKDAKGSVELTLRMMRNRTYHIAFWAQNSQTDAYDTHDLQEVKVNYKTVNEADEEVDPKNNDELRDAFCKVEILSITENSGSRSVVLTRPFAQINVGTTGADYKRVIEKGRTVTHSKIELKGVAQYFNVVEDNVIVDEDHHPLTTVTFDFNKIPAYIKLESIPTPAPEKTYEDGYVKDDKLQKGEEFLKINLDHNNADLKPYKTTYPTIEINNNTRTFLTETFKYLSMCYILVPSDKTVIPDYTKKDGNTTTDPYTSSTLKSVTLEIAETQTNGEANKANSRQSIKGLQNVPVHRNWRTNILCGLHDKNPGDLGQDDDPTSIWGATAISVTIDSYFNGEYNTTDEGDTWNQDTYGDNPPSSEE